MVIADPGVDSLRRLRFVGTSLLCGLAWNIQSMIAFRAIQGFLGGSMGSGWS